MLECAAFAFRDVVAGRTTSWTRGVLELNLATLAETAGREPGLIEVRAHVVRPGEPVRLINVLDVVEPAVKIGSPGTTFPGALGSLTVAGTGVTHRLDEAAVIATANLRQFPNPGGPDAVQDSVVDMAGPGANYCRWSSTTNIVLDFDCDPTVSVADIDRSIRRATLRVARDLAATTVDIAPDLVDSFAPAAVDHNLPAICVILQLESQGTTSDTFLYGASVDGMLPTFLDGREVLDGAVTSGAYHWASMRNPTYFYQRNRLIRSLLDADGSRLRFVGVIVTRAYFMSAFEKSRSAFLAAKLARQIGADGAILTTIAGGNSHTDTMLTCRACEKVGVRTTSILAEMGGLTDWVAEADALVSVGNTEELVAEWRPEIVLGGEALRNRSAFDAGPIPVRNYLGATSQMGDMRLKAVEG
jgi:glycine reductase complex component B subunit alpha and beta